MNYIAILAFYMRNQKQIQEIESKIKPGVEGGHALLLAWISANLAIAQRMWPEYKDLLGDLNSTLTEVIGK